MFMYNKDITVHVTLHSLIDSIQQVLYSFATGIPYLLNQNDVIASYYLSKYNYYLNIGICLLACNSQCTFCT